MRMDVRIRPHTLAGAVTPPPSKSMAHRLLLAAALADGVSTVKNVALSQDIEATLRCMAALGASWERTDKSTLRVTGIGGKRKPFPELPRFDCGESGSTLRFLLPVAAALACDARLTGHGRLPERPLSPLYEELVAHGSELGPKGIMPLSVGGSLSAGRFTIAGNVSSQYVSGLLMAAPLLDQPTEVLVTEPVESLPYIDLTIAALREFGVEVARKKVTTPDGGALSLTAGPRPGLVSPGGVTVGGDWSNAAFWLCAAALGNPVRVTGVSPDSVQGDRAVLGALALLGARVSRQPGAVDVTPDDPRGTRLDVRSCPDLVPPLAAVAACSLNPGAYIAEIFRAGIEAVDAGQMEAALCVGMKKGLAMRLVVLPQAIKNVVPALCNEFVTLIKETAVISYLGVADLFYMNSVVKTMTYNMLPCYLILAGFYFVLCFAASRLVGVLERRLRA